VSFSYNAQQRRTDRQTDNIVTPVGSSALSKSYQLDPASTWLVKDMRGLLSCTFCCTAVHQVTEDWLFSGRFQVTVIRPLLKKS